VKERVKKGYRHPEIDRRLRRERNRKEARMMRRAAGGLRVPKLIETGEFEIKMEFVDGTPLRELKKLPARKMGRTVSALHSLGIAHGDLTTSNMLLKDGEIVLIDFGLADWGRVEDFATDLKVLFEAAEAMQEFSREDFLDEYGKTPGSEKVLKRLERVYSRGRYLSRSR